MNRRIPVTDDILPAVNLGRNQPPERYRFADLATYNAERARGLVHTPEWDARMAEQQAAFNAERASGG